MPPVRRADNLTTFMCRLSRHLGASTSWNPKGLSRSVMGLLYLVPQVCMSAVQPLFCYRQYNAQNCVVYFAVLLTSSESTINGHEDQFFQWHNSP
jgi:hypothetical protein